MYEDDGWIGSDGEKDIDMSTCTLDKGAKGQLVLDS